MISKFHEFSNLIFGGFLLIGPTVRWRLCNRSKVRTIAGFLDYAVTCTTALPLNKKTFWPISISQVLVEVWLFPIQTFLLNCIKKSIELSSVSFILNKKGKKSPQRIVCGRELWKSWQEFKQILWDKKRVQKGFQILFLLSFFRHCKMAFYRKAQDRGEPKNLGGLGKKSKKSLISTGKNEIAKNWRKKFASIS